jgi:hypothetical protein
MASVDIKNREDINVKLEELESVKQGTDFSFGQILEVKKNKAHWYLAKSYCYAVQRLFPEFDLHHRLLRIALAGLDEIEGLQSPLV